MKCSVAEKQVGDAVVEELVGAVEGGVPPDRALSVLETALQTRWQSVFRGTGFGIRTPGR